MKKFIEEDFELDKSSPIEFIKSILIMILLAPARFLLTLSTKIVYLPKVAIERSLLFAVIVACSITVVDVGVEMYLGTFRTNSIFLISCLICCAVLIVGYFVFTTGTFVIYEQMSSMIARAVPVQQEYDEQDLDTLDDLTEPTEGVSEEPVAPKSVVPGPEPVVAETAPVPETEGPERSERRSRRRRRTERAKEEQPQRTLKDDLSGSAVPSFDNLDDIFAGNDDDDEESSKFVIDSKPIRDFQNSLRDKIAGIADTGVSIGKKLNEEETRSIMREMDESTDPSAFISEDCLKKIGDDFRVADDLNLDALQLSVIPNNFKALS